MFGFFSGGRRGRKPVINKRYANALKVVKMPIPDIVPDQNGSSLTPP